MTALGTWVSSLATSAVSEACGALHSVVVAGLASLEEGRTAEGRRTMVGKWGWGWGGEVAECDPASHTLPTHG